MISLDSPERKRSNMPCLVKKAAGLSAVHSQYRFRISPARAHVNQSMRGQAVIRRSLMDSINFHKKSRLLGHWPDRILMPLLPFGILGHPMPPKHSFHRRNTDHNTFLTKSPMNNLGTLISLSSQIENTPDDYRIQSIRRMFWSR